MDATRAYRLAEFWYGTDPEMVIQLAAEKLMEQEDDDEDEGALA